jgi:hypothetical protein
MERHLAETVSERNELARELAEVHLALLTLGGGGGHFVASLPPSPGPASPGDVGISRPVQAGRRHSEGGGGGGLGDVRASILETRTKLAAGREVRARFGPFLVLFGPFRVLFCPFWVIFCPLWVILVLRGPFWPSRAFRSHLVLRGPS